ncbi:hypothetical protein [Streptomyces sp. SDr-06]|uniref:hypothetical protein n=1 Tax=Streptomyces sp. SDr-06 TaxID=2267702 RepID=UPI00167A3BAC|nr:hypothetical protein [Streptomyces sp. SDr-06]
MGGEVARAMSRHPEGLTLDELAATTGLNTIQLQAAALWSARGSDDEAGLPADA